MRQRLKKKGRKKGKKALIVTAMQTRKRAVAEVRPSRAYLN